MSLRALAAELDALCAVYDEPRGFADPGEAVREPLAQRIAELADEINDQMSTVPVASLDDCLVRLKLLRTVAPFRPDGWDAAFDWAIHFLRGYAAAAGLLGEPVSSECQLHALDREYRALNRALDGLAGILDNPDEDDAYRAAADRMYEVLRAINVTPPRNFRDCAIKLQRLADPEHGMAEGEIDNDDVCLTQVIKFIEAAAV